MKSFNSLNVSELSIEEQKSTEGGSFWGLVGVVFLVGFVVGLFST